MKLGILKTDDVHPDLVGRYGEYPQQFSQLLREVAPELVFCSYDVARGEYPSFVDECDAYLITGSKASVYDDEPWIHRLAEYVRKLYRHRKKLVGICFGHQMVAHALGGKTERAQQGWGVGVHTVTLADNQQPIKLLVSHQDQVTVPAENAKVLAGSDFCPNAICQLDDRVLSFQGHPEFTRAYCEGLLYLRRERLGERIFQQGIASLVEETDHLQVARWIVSFITSEAE